MGYKDWPWDITEGRTGHRYTTNSNPKLVIHTTEGTHWPDYPWPPHITFNPASQAIRRHVASDLGAYALRSPGGGRSPNYQGGPAFQIEVISFARESFGKSDVWYARLGALIREVCDDLGIPKMLHPKGFVGGQAYGTSGVNRISWDDYRQFSGILGHQHVPFNTHWDPGNLDEKKLEKAIGGTMTDPRLKDQYKIELMSWARPTFQWMIDNGYYTEETDINKVRESYEFQQITVNLRRAIDNEIRDAIAKVAVGAGSGGLSEANVAAMIKGTTLMPPK